MDRQSQLNSVAVLPQDTFARVGKKSPAKKTLFCGFSTHYAYMEIIFEYSNHRLSYIKKKPGFTGKKRGFANPNICLIRTHQKDQFYAAITAIKTSN